MVVLQMEVEVASVMVDANNAPRLCAHALEEAKMPFNASVVKSECVADDANNTIRKTSTKSENPVASSLVRRAGRDCVDACANAKVLINRSP